ncbi:MAG: hypothetical protein ACJAZP_001047 [Psychromonas sp.]|jgi:hypothetical protein|uniref:MGMT family protein n=1 Tax=Psychromonas sp. TaxID=1884585 RepID=UPI0039E4FDBD
MSYGEVTKQLENPKAVRAVGTACGKNPIGVLIPCLTKTAYLILPINARHKQFLSIPASIFINANLMH